MLFFKKFPNLTVVLACLFWGTYWIPLRYIDSNNNSSIWPIFISFLILSIFLFFPLLRSLNIIFSKKNYFFLFGCFFCGSAVVLYSESLLRGEIAKVVVLFYLAPVWGTILARFLLKQKLNIIRIISIALGLIGLEIMFGFDKGVFIPVKVVEWIALFAGFSWALGTVLFHIADSSTGIEKTSLTSVFIAFIFLLFCLVPGGRSFATSNILITLNSLYVWIILFSLLWLLPSILLTFLSIEILDPGRLNLLLAFEVVVGFLSAALLTDEIIGLREIVGAFFVVSACCSDVFLNKKN